MPSEYHYKATVVIQFKVHGFFQKNLSFDGRLVLKLGCVL